jgi:hypothetical protein
MPGEQPCINRYFHRIFCCALSTDVPKLDMPKLVAGHGECQLSQGR